MDLSVFEAKALAHALTEHGHSVSERTVQRWKAGVTKPKPQDTRAIRQLLGIEKEASPSMTRRLLVGMMALETKAGITVDELSSAEAAMEAALEVDARIAAELEASRRTSGGRTPGQGGGQSGASLGSKRSTP